MGWDSISEKQKCKNPNAYELFNISGDNLKSK